MDYPQITVVRLHLGDINVCVSNGTDEIHLAIIKRSANVIVTPLWKLHMRTQRPGYLPEYCKTAVVVSVCKGGSWMKVENYELVGFKVSSTKC